MTHAVVAEGLSKSYFIATRDGAGNLIRTEKRALQDVTFSVPEGEALGIIGKNGSGKSTLLKILSRITAPSRGHATVRGTIASLLEVGTGMHHEMTGRENVFLNGSMLGMAKAEISRRLDEIVDFAGVAEYLDVPIKHYSSGMKLRLAFAVAAHLSADVMIVDEVLAVGDAEFQRKCLGLLRAGARRARTTLFVSHHLPSIESLCDRVLLLSAGHIAATGNPGDVIRQYLRMNARHEREIAAAAIDLRQAPRGWTMGGARLTSIAFERIGGWNTDGPPWVLAFGERWGVRIAIELDRPVVDLVVGIGIKSETGQEVLTTHSCDSGRQISGAPGERYVATVDLSTTNLLPGQYYLEAALLSQRSLIDHTPECATITVEERLHSDALHLGLKKGLVAPALPWKIT